MKYRKREYDDGTDEGGIMAASHHFTTIVSLVITQKDRQKHRRIGKESMMMELTRVALWWQATTLPPLSVSSSPRRIDRSIEG